MLFFKFPFCRLFKKGQSAKVKEKRRAYKEKNDVKQN